MVDQEKELSGLEKRLLEEPDYRPYCLSCGTMQRMTLTEWNGRRVMKCEIKGEDHEGAKILRERFGIPPRVGCGVVFDIRSGQKYVEPRRPLPGEQGYAPLITD